MSNETNANTASTAGEAFLAGLATITINGKALLSIIIIATLGAGAVLGLFLALLL